MPDRHIAAMPAGPQLRCGNPIGYWDAPGLVAARAWSRARLTKKLPETLFVFAYLLIRG
jgi:hypothetical protein